jgi:hypothetical protein
MNISDNLLNTKNIIGEDSSIFTRKHYLNLITGLIIWLSGAFFILKFFGDALLKIILYSIIFVAVIIFIDRTEKHYKSFLTKNHLFFIMLLVTAAAFLLYRLEHINYSLIAGFTIFWLAVIYQAQNVKVELLQLAVFLLSPGLYAEMISFSGSFSLVMLVIVSIFISDRFLDNSKLDWKFFLLAFLFGAILSIEQLVSFIYLVYLIYRFRYEIMKGLVFVLGVLVVYAVLVLLADKGNLIITVWQTNYFQMLPIWIIVILALVTLYVAWVVADLQEVLFASGIVLFFIFILIFLLRVSQFGWNKNEIDLSFLVIAIPFLVLSIKEYKVDRFLGKVIS